MDGGWPEFELRVLIARAYNKWLFDPEIDEALESDYQRTLLIHSLKVKSTDEKILELLAVQYPELLRHLADRVGNASLLPTWTKEHRVTMADLYPDKEKPKASGGVLIFPGQPPLFVG